MADVSVVLEKMRGFFDTNVTKSLSFRIEALKRLRTAIIDNEKIICDALYQDLNKPEYEAYSTEIGMVLYEISFALKNIKKWAKPKRVKTPLMHFLAKSYIYPEPYGVALIIAPWNYPFQLTLSPLVGAIAAGNCAVLKPSPDSPATSKVLDTIISKTFSPDFISVISGGHFVHEMLLTHRFDYIFFTGSPKSGKVVAAAAAKYLTPVTLELGGKSPCIVDETANISLSAKRIAWGKCVNSGQTCVAPDYVYIHASKRDEFIQAFDSHVRQFYSVRPVISPDYCKIVNEKHFNRLNDLAQCGEKASGGIVDNEFLKMSPTLLTGVTWDDKVMGEEIFGPILPIFTFTDISEPIKQIKSREKPLALYLFSHDKAVQMRILKEVSFGGGCINDTVMHIANIHLPFGGVGGSGTGAYHGFYSFETFSHKKSVLKKSDLIDIKARYAPYDKSMDILKSFLR